MHPFSYADWDIFAGAERWEDQSLPLVYWHDRFSLVADRNGFELSWMDEDGDNAGSASFSIELPYLLALCVGEELVRRLNIYLYKDSLTPLSWVEQTELGHSFTLI